MKVNIKGVILNSIYDTQENFQHILNGVMTPESYFRKQVDKVEKENQPVELYISSEGGDVFAANEMSNSIVNKDVSVTVGALAASAAAGIVLNLKNAGKKVKAYKNTKLMFHGAMSGAIGGAQALQDEANLLNKINADQKDLLIKHGLKKDEVEQAFAEGRMLWMNADEALQYGIVDEIIDGKADKITISKVNNKALVTQSAVMEEIEKAQSEDIEIIKDNDTAEEVKAEIIAEVIAEVVNTTEEVKTETVETTPEIVPVVETVPVVEEPKQVVQTFDINKYTQLLSNYDAITQKYNDAVVKMQEMDNKFIDMESKLKTITEMIETVGKKEKEIKNVKAKALEYKVNDAPTSWLEALDKCNGDYVMARKTYPTIYAKLFEK